jgi:hypothetical protein
VDTYDDGTTVLKNKKNATIHIALKARHDGSERGLPCVAVVEDDQDQQHARLAFIGLTSDIIPEMELFRRR